MDPQATDFSRNHILAALPAETLQRLMPHLEVVGLEQGRVLYEIDQQITELYFPFNAMISLVTQMEDGKIVEVGLVGNDGMSGIASLMGRETSFERALVQIPNGGARIDVAIVKEEFKKGGALQTSAALHGRTHAAGFSNRSLQRVSHD